MIFSLSLSVGQVFCLLVGTHVASNVYEKVDSWLIARHTRYKEIIFDWSNSLTDKIIVSMIPKSRAPSSASQINNNQVYLHTAFMLFE